MCSCDLAGMPAIAHQDLVAKGKCVVSGSHRHDEVVVVPTVSRIVQFFSTACRQFASHQQRVSGDHVADDHAFHTVVRAARIPIGFDGRVIAEFPTSTKASLLAGVRFQRTDITLGDYWGWQRTDEHFNLGGFPDIVLVRYGNIVAAGPGNGCQEIQVVPQVFFIAD